jgi:hypothetical protein
MRASPYDLRELGYEPIPVETPEGRADYVRRQRDFAASCTIASRILASFLFPRRVADWMALIALAGFQYCSYLIKLFLQDTNLVCREWAYKIVKCEIPPSRWSN